MHAEISYDLVMDDDMEFVEGAYRLPGEDWQVVIVSAFDRDVPESLVTPQRFESGYTAPAPCNSDSKDWVVRRIEQSAGR